MPAVPSPRFKLGDYVISKCEQKRREVFPDFETHPTIYQIVSIRTEQTSGGTDITYLLAGGEDNQLGHYTSVNESELLSVSVIQEKD